MRSLTTSFRNSLKSSFWIFSVFLFLFLTFPLSHLALAEEGGVGGVLNGWEIKGSNTLRSDYFNVTGDTAASPYRFEGLQTFDEFNLGMTRRLTPFDTWRLQVFGVANDSDYRNMEDNGFIPERLYIMREKGDTAVPYRFEAGDFYAFLTFRTLQRTLKGVQLELQPRIRSGVRRHSILLLSGAAQNSWRHVQAEDDYFNALSWLVSDEILGRWGLNVVHNSRQRESEAGALKRDQVTASIAGEKAFTAGSHRVTIEVEASRFKGDHDGVAGPESGQERSENGIFTQVSGRGGSPFSYRFRYESYGQDYRPRGSVVTPDRRSAEAHLGWRLAGGTFLNGRFQRFRDDLETDNHTDTNTYGINLRGRLMPGISVNIDTFVQRVENQDKTTQREVDSFNANLSSSLGASWNGRVGVFLRRTEDFVTDANDATSRQVSASADHALNLGSLKGSFMIGMTARWNDAAAKTRDVAPLMAMNFNTGFHRIGMHLGLSDQDRADSGSTDVAAYDLRGNYDYTRGRHKIGIEVSMEIRNPDPGEKTESLRAGVFWTYFFEKLARPRVERAPLAAPPAPKEAVDLADIIPGSIVADVTAMLDRVGIKGPAEQPGIIVFETRLFEEIDERQRLAIVHDGSLVKKAAIIIDFDDIGRPDDMMVTFERVREALIERYGAPAGFFEQGEWGETVSLDVNDGAFVRIVEWSVKGGVIRFGIPRRLDRGIRMEVQFAEGFPPLARETLWSLEEVR